MNGSSRYSWIFSVLLLAACTSGPTTQTVATSPSNNSTNSNGSSQTTWSNSCGVIPGVAGSTYCVYQNSPTPQSTIWFFHGLGDSPQAFRDSGLGRESFQALLKGLPPTKIIAVSLGESWLLTLYPERTFAPVNSTVDTFVKQMLPFGEKNLGAVKPYVLMGHSMGGFNAATLCASNPDLWSKCVLLNPMLPSCDPWIPPSQALASTGCNPAAGFIIRDHFTESGWNATQPLALLKFTKRLPKSFVTACAMDSFGLFDGPKAWSDQARAQGLDSVFNPVQSGCDHTHWPTDAVLTFLRKP